MEYFYNEGPAPTVATPTFSPAEGTYFEAQNVTIACATTGATLQYKLTENGEWQNYTSAISVTETTTIWAKATLGEESSEASATYTIPTLITMLAAHELENNAYGLVEGVVTFIDGRNVFAQDETGGICLFLNDGTVPSGLAIGDKVRAYGQRAAYKGLIELKNIDGNSSAFTTVSTGNTLPLAVKTISEVLTGGAGVLQSTRVKIVNATIGTIDTDGDTPLTQGESTTNIYKVPALTGIEEGNQVNVIGVIGYYNAAQIRVANAEDVVLYVNTDPIIEVDHASLSFTYVYGGSAAAQNLIISGDNLEDDITITLSGANFAISEDGIDWDQTTLTIDQGDAIGEIEVRLNSGLAIGANYTGTITLSSEGADDVEVNLSGEVTTPTHSLALYSDEITGGSISFSPASPVPQGATVTLTATPSAGYEFGSWVFYKEVTTDYVVDESIEVNANNEFTMPTYDLWVDATFTELPTYAITAVASPAAGGTVVTDNEAWEGKTVEIEVEANDGYALQSLTATYVDGNEETKQLTITDNTFTMPAYAVTVTATFVEYHAYVIDFENELSAYADWEFYKITRTSSNSAHGGSYYATNSTNNSSASITTKNKIANPGTLTFYVKRTSSNTNSAKWYVKTSTDGETWTERGNQDATTENWTKYEIDLSPYTNVYVQIAYNGNTALRAIDDISLAYTPAASYALSVTSVEHATITANVGSTIIAEGTSSNVESGLMVALNAELDANYQLASWSVYKTGDPATIVEVDANNQFEMPAYPVTVSATFNETCTLTYSVNGNASNEVVVKGLEVTLTVPTANIPSGFDFIGWTSNPANVADADLVTSLTMNANATVYAVFGKSNTLTLTGDDFATSYPEEETQYAFRGIKFGVKQVMKSGGIQFHKGDGYIYNKDAFVGLASIVATRTTSSYICTLKVGNSSNPNEGTEIEALTSGNVDTYTFSDNYSYIVLMNENGSNAVKYSSIVFTFNNTDPARYTRVFLNETLTDDLEINGPSIIPSGSVLDASGKNFTNATAANLIIEDGGQIILANDNTGVYAKVQKNITGYGEGNGNWYLLSAPTEATLNANPKYPSDVHVVNLMPADIGDEHMFDLYSFDQTKSHEWQNFRNEDVDNKAFYPQKGLLYARKESATIEFNVELTAAPNNNQRLVYDETASFKGWNLLGNAMMCNQYVGLYCHDEFVTSDYYRMNEAGTALELCENGAPVAPMEGFFMQAPNGNGYSVVVHFSSTPFVDNNMAIDLNVTYNNAIVDRARVRFGEGSMLGKFTLNENNTKLYIPQGSKDYAVVRSANEGEMPVSFKAEENGSYTLSVNPENVEMEYLHLIDNMTGADVDLLATPSYTFEARTNDYASRFRLVFSANGVEENGASTGSATFAYFNGTNWTVNNTGDATLQVVDVMGRVLSSETLSGNTEININQPAGVYMLRLVTGNDVKVQKVVVQ